MRVKFVVMGGPVEEVELAEGASVADLLALLAFDPGTGAIYVNSALQGTEAIVRDGDLVVVAWDVRGEVRVKSRNHSWAVHKSDADEVFPSDFHAHDAQSEMVVDLYTGYVYSSVTRKRVDKLAGKKLRLVLGQLSRCKEPEIRGKATRALDCSIEARARTRLRPRS